MKEHAMTKNGDSAQGRSRNLDEVVSKTERLGVIGSPSRTSELSVDVIGTAVGRKLVGELAMFSFQQDGVSHYALGQITEIELRNVWHEDPTMRSLIRQRGRVDAVSERQDTHIGNMTISAVFKHMAAASLNGASPDGPCYEPSIMGTVPSTGTTIHLVNDDVLETVLHRYRDQIFYLGHVYGSTPKLPLWFKHFGSGPDGAGEAYHLGIFGKTGSGKSVLAKMTLCAYMRYKQMGLLILDPQGEFARDFRSGGSGQMRIPLSSIATQYGKKFTILSVRNLVLDRWELFEEILFEADFFQQLTMPRGDNRRDACAKLADELRKKKIKLEELNSRTAFDTAWSILADPKVQQVFYRTTSSRDRFESARADADPDEFYTRFWQPVTALFDKSRKDARTVERALEWLLSLNQTNGARPVLIIDLSREQAEGLLWNDMIQSLVIKRLLDGITHTAERHFQDGDEKGLNTLVLIDEAHRLAPRHLPENGDAAASVRGVLIDAVRTTRKYGLGWLFISQTLSSLHTEILQQLRIQFFGFGLSMGQEFQALRQHVGGNDAALRLYGLFRDPHSSFDTASRQYSFMTTGPISPLSFAGTPLFLNAFNSVESFMSANAFTLPEAD
jgi:hypothetical protein